MSHPPTSVREQMGSASARGWSGWSARSPKYHNPLDLLGECVIHPDSPESHRKCYSSSQAAAESSRMDLAVFSLRVIFCEMLQLNWELRSLPENPHFSSAKSGLFHSLQEVGYECFSLKRSGDPYSSHSEGLPDYGWCYFLHEIREPCIYPQTRDCSTWFPSVQKCLISCWPQTRTPCEVWCFSSFW